MLDEYARSVEDFHAARVGRLRSGTGWLSLVGKTYFGQGTTAIDLPDGGGVIGYVTLEGKVVRFDAKDTDVVLASGEPVGSRVLRSDRLGKADAIHARGFKLEVMERGEAFAFRIRDTRVLPRPYAGISRFALDPTWRVRATLEAYAEPRPVDIDFEGATGSAADTLLSPGAVVFERSGAQHRIEAAFEDETQRRLFLLFRDATSGGESYGPGRFVYAPLPNEQGEVIVDFNLALLPGCAFTTFATCPLPPKQNRLGIPVRAGEREYLAPPVGA